jgi:uncharacterized protein YjbI with pentapeptide repeats
MSKDCTTCKSKIRDMAAICPFCGERQPLPSGVKRDTSQLEAVLHWDGKTSLQDIDLSWCDLSRVDLKGANLEGAKVKSDFSCKSGA